MARTLRHRHPQLQFPTVPPSAIALTLLPLLTLRLSAAHPAPEFIAATVKVDLQKVVRPINPYFLGMGLHPGERHNIQQPDSAASVRDFLGLKSIRFPNGCEADRYGWQGAATNGFITVDEFLDFCDRTSCRPYYILNLQGGTEGLDGPIPAGASLEQQLRYKHLAPNPCGYPPTSYHYGTLAETIQLVEKYTVQRLLAGKTPILDYEMGNENWGQATTDWPPDVYAKTVELYARAIRDVFQHARAQHPEWPAGLNLRLTAVGYPVMGNNQDPRQATRYDINTTWTQGLNQLHTQGLLDAVQEHFYAYSTATGDALVWVEHNLNNILLARRGVPNPTLGGYIDAQLAYQMPIDITEWNIKCWGPEPRFLKVPNGEFEAGLSGWTTEASPKGIARFDTPTEAARHGAAGLQLRTRAGCDWAEARLTLPPLKQTELTLLAWVRTDSPTNVSLSLRSAGKTLVECTASTRNRWQRYAVTGKLSGTNATAEVVLRATAPGVSAWFDDIEVASYDSAGSRCPLSVNTYEQQLYCVDAIRQMLEHGVQRTFFHHIFGSYGCPAIAADGTLRDNAKAFHLYADRIGQDLLKTETQTPSFDYDGHSGKWATDFNAVPPATTNVPCLSALATRDSNRVYLLLLNRSTDRTAKTKVRLSAAPASLVEIRTLSGEDYNAYGAFLTTNTIRLGKTFTQQVPPHTAQMLSFQVTPP